MMECGKSGWERGDRDVNHFSDKSLKNEIKGQTCKTNKRKTLKILFTSNYCLCQNSCS